MQTQEKTLLDLSAIKTLLGGVVLKDVSRATGLHYDTVRQIANGMQGNPTYSVLRALSRYFQERV